jgi:hypothetical protein
LNILKISENLFLYFSIQECYDKYINPNNKERKKVRKLNCNQSVYEAIEENQSEHIDNPTLPEEDLNDEALEMNYENEFGTTQIEHHVARNVSKSNNTNLDNYRSNLSSSPCFECEIQRQHKEEAYEMIKHLEVKLRRTAADFVEVSEQLLKMNKYCEDLQEEHTKILKKYEESCTQIQRVKEKLHQLFTNDQVARLQDGVTRGRTYDEDTITSSISLWFSSGSVGYSHLLHKGFPFPSISTLQKRLSKVVFLPGRPLYMNELLSRKVNIIISNSLLCLWFLLFQRFIILY